MKTALTLGFLITVSSLLGGCATTSDVVGGPIARCDTSRTVAHRDADRYAASYQRVEPTSASAGPREGTPTPEPALPAPETRFAGPTPQVPIPVVSVAIGATRW
ncbi:MAG: hypothetical protein U0325_15570 [Polyangiales bacterium]